MIKFFVLILTLMALAACGSAPEPSPGIATEALTTTDVDMWANPSHLPPPPGFTGVYTVVQDPAHQTPLLLFFNVSPDIALGRQYFSAAHDAQGQLFPSEWVPLTQLLQAGYTQGLSTKVRLSYDSSAVGNDKTWIAISVYQCPGHGVQFGTECGGPRFPMNRFWDPTNVMLGYECTTTTGQNGTMVSKCAQIPSTCGFLYCVAN